MNEPDWNELWVLNALVCDYCRLSQLIHEPEVESYHRGYWLFPSRSFPEASVQDRIGAIERCLRRGLVEIYRGSWLAAHRFGEGQARVDDLQVGESESLEEHHVMLTQEGQQQWEKEFQPDWDRYWMHWGGEHDATSERETISLLYASDEILNELIQWIPSVWQYDDTAGMIRLESYTYFQHQVTLWKTLPCVKVTKWRVKRIVGAWNALLQAKVPANVPDNHPIRMAGFAQVRELMNQSVEKAHEARKVLLRLSKRW